MSLIQFSLYSILHFHGMFLKTEKTDIGMLPLTNSRFSLELSSCFINFLFLL